MAKNAKDYARQQEILFDLSFQLGVLWKTMDSATSDAAMEVLGGSRGLFSRVKHWVEEFDHDWETREHDPELDYLDAVYTYATIKMGELMAEAGIEKLKNHANEVRKTFVTRIDEVIRKLTSLLQFKDAVTQHELNWLTQTHNKLFFTDATPELRELVHMATLLLGQVIADLYDRGTTYTDMGKAMGVSNSRVSEIAAKYRRSMRMDELRVQHGRPTRLPWKQ